MFQLLICSHFTSLIFSTRKFSACGISDEETGTVLITGGYNGSESKSLTRVSRYNTTGWVEDIAELNIARANHACSSYISQSGERVI